MVTLPSHKTKRKKRKNKKGKIRRLLYLILTTLFVTVGWGVGETYWQSGHPSAIQNVAASPVVGDSTDSYKSLTLAESAKATYTNTQIKRIKELPPSGSINISVVSFSVPKDNISEKALMTIPSTPAPVGGFPVIILCHGYADPGVYSTEKAYLEDMEFYSQNGFAVIKPDFRGQGLSITDGTADGAYYSMAYNTDVMSLIAAVKKTDYLNKNNINIWGHSMGGYIALRAAVLSPDIKNVILLSAPVGFIQDMFTSYVAISDSSNPQAGDIRSQQLADHGTPVSNPEYWNGTSPLDYLEHTKAHIQIHVGTLDGIVPAHFSADLDQQLTKLGKAHSYYVYPGGRHGLVRERSAVWSRSLQLLKQNP